MRQIRENQQHLAPSWGAHQHSRELAMISTILDDNPDIARMAHKDLVGSKLSNVGRDGMNGDQAVRAALIKQIHGLSYRELAFHLGDSQAFMTFARLPLGTRLEKSALQSNIKGLGPATWEAINQVLVKYAEEKDIEKGRKVRTDCTVVESNIHEPTDSNLLWDCVRVVTRLVGRAVETFPELDWDFHDHSRRTKRRSYEIAFPKKRKDKEKQRKRAYRDLLLISNQVYDYGQKAEAQLRALRPLDIMDAIFARGLAEELGGYLESMVRVIDQTRRRVMDGESVPSEDKMVSIFETHTNIIVKDNRDTLFGHKICLAGGASSMILDCVVEEGNPADSTLVERGIERLIELYGRPPRQASYDGGFASKDNVRIAKGLGVKDVAFHKKRGLKVSDMVKSAWVFKRLRNFRAGIEGCISTLKRAFKMNRCTWRGMEAFKSYVWSCIVSFNMIVIARHLLSKP